MTVVTTVTTPRATPEVIAEIRGEMARQGVRQQDLAERTGMSLRALRRRFAGEAPLLVGELLAIAEQLDVAPAQLLSTESKTGSRRDHGGSRTPTPPCGRKRARAPERGLSPRYRRAPRGCRPPCPSPRYPRN